jgi:hypothetical protein
MGAKLALALLTVRCFAQSVDPAGLTLTGIWQLDGAVYATQTAGSCVIAATMGGSLYCLDPTHPGLITWRTHLANPQTTSTALTFYGKAIGCLSKPAVNTTTIYAVCASPAGYTVYTLDLASGSVLGSTAIAASVAGAGCDSVSGVVTFAAAEQIQRPALLLTGSTLVVAFGSNSDISPWHGWLMTYDVSTSTPALTHVWNSTPNSCGGAIWQSASPVVTDGSFYYLATGNGTGEHSMQVAKLDPSLNVVATWTVPNESTENANDADVSSGAPLLISGSVLAIGSKDWHARLLFTSDLTLAADVPTNPSPPALNGDDGIYGGFFSFDGGESRVYFPNKPGPIYAFTFTAGGLTPLAVGSASYTSTMALAMTAGVLWAVTTSVDPYASTPWKQITGTLRALDPATLAEMWSADIGNMASFSGPAFTDGHVYIGNVDGVVRMFSHDAPVLTPITGNSVTLVGWQQQ